MNTEYYAKYFIDNRTRRAVGTSQWLWDTCRTKWLLQGSCSLWTCDLFSAGIIQSSPASVSDLGRPLMTCSGGRHVRRPARRLGLTSSGLVYQRSW